MLSVLVLLGGCATVAALVMVDAERRRTEIAVKVALGASRAQLITERSIELAGVAVSGGICALGVAQIGLRTIPALSLPGGIDLGRVDLILDWRVFTAALVATVVVLLASASWPVARSTRGARASELWAGAGMTASRRSQRMRQALLALQVCASIAVLVAASLFVQAVVRGFGTSAGFDIDRTVTVSVQLLSPVADPGPTALKTISTRAERARVAIRSVPGVQSGTDGSLPIGIEAARLLSTAITLETGGRVRSLPLGRLDGGPELLSVLGVPIVAGRALTSADATAVPIPAIVTASLAEKLWPQGDSLGQVVTTSLHGGRLVVVGIARDFVFGSLTGGVTDTVVTARSGSGFSWRFAVRTQHPATLVNPIREVVTTALPEAAWVNVSTGR
ncbi:MAG TPA: FtsX-like permease family protein, partial [Vicinamibacterales bacterium]|nr:FtsX-like permease family protein [Vicinamibacterales bacterium]